MESKKIIPILIAVIIIVSILITFKTAERINKNYGKEKEQAGNDNKGRNEQELPQLKPTSESAGEAESSQGASEGTGGGASGSSGLPDENRTDLPSDINTRPCSFYFSEYGVCAGTCPRGTCKHIGKSCYCVLS